MPAMKWRDPDFGESVGPRVAWSPTATHMQRKCGRTPLSLADVIRGKVKRWRVTAETLDQEIGPSQVHRGTLRPGRTSAAEFGYAAIASVVQRKYAFSVARNASSLGKPASSSANAKQICARSSISL